MHTSNAAGEPGIRWPSRRDEQVTAAEHPAGGRPWWPAGAGLERSST